MAARDVLESESYSETVEESDPDPYEAGNDEYPDYACHPCGKSGKIEAATKFCIDCGYLMCSTCLDHHNKFDLMKGHQVTTAEASTKYESHDRTTVPTIRCNKHNGKVIDMYCSLHETPGCVTCMSLKHSACAGKEYIPKVAEGIKNSDEYKKMVTLYEKTTNALKNSQGGKEQCLTILEETTARSFNTIDEKRTAINIYVDSKQKNMKNEIQQRRNRKTTEVLDQISELKENIARMEDNKTKIKCCELNDSDAFIVLKTTNVAVEDAAETNDEELTDALTSITVLDSPDVLVLFEGLNLFGQIAYHINAKFVKDCPIKTSVDKKVACITDTCLMDDGNIILADQNNRVIKKLGATFQLGDKCTLKIPGKPAAICQTKYPEVAIALLSNKSIQFATVLSPMSLTKSFSIEEACRGIAFSNAALYLACGGMLKYSDGPAEIRVYDQGGDLCRKYTKISGKRSSIPKRIAATSSDVFFADSDGGVFGLGVNGGGEKGPFTHRDMVSPIGLCGLTRGVLIVCGYESHNVMLLYEKDGSMKPLIGIDQGLKHPKSVCLDSTGKKLLVTMSDVDYIKVFDLIMQ